MVAARWGRTVRGHCPIVPRLLVVAARSGRAGLVADRHRPRWPMPPCRSWAVAARTVNRRKGWADAGGFPRCRFPRAPFLSLLAARCSLLAARCSRVDCRLSAWVGCVLLFQGRPRARAADRRGSECPCVRMAVDRSGLGVRAPVVAAADGGRGRGAPPDLGRPGACSCSAAPGLSVCVRGPCRLPAPCRVVSCRGASSGRGHRRLGARPPLGAAEGPLVTAGRAPPPADGRRGPEPCRGGRVRPGWRRTAKCASTSPTPASPDPAEPS